jgi:hypothetical protein
MPSGSFDILAPPFFWGPTTGITGVMGNSAFKFTLSASLISDMQGPFKGEISYFGEDGDEVLSFDGLPASTTFVTAVNTAQEPTVRFKSYGPTGLQLRVNYSVIAVSQAA